MKALHLLLYKVRLRMVVRREEHHRVVNDSDHGAKSEGLWGARFATNVGSKCSCVCRREGPRVGQVACSVCRSNGVHQARHELQQEALV